MRRIIALLTQAALGRYVGPGIDCQIERDTLSSLPRSVREQGGLLADERVDSLA
jgi:hypothetical protein